ncbi:hypothetical protein CRUP_009825 [Coryphaenoides rupestris]|nr:hypothetical protein CRUP_009825 [Coryphaenoides rupestris]
MELFSEQRESQEPFWPSNPGDISSRYFFQKGLILRCPPMSQTFSFMPCEAHTLNVEALRAARQTERRKRKSHRRDHRAPGSLTCVGVMVLTSSEARLRSSVVLPALSRPSNTMRSSCSDLKTHHHHRHHHRHTTTTLSIPDQLSLSDRTSRPTTTTATTTAATTTATTTTTTTTATTTLSFPDQLSLSGRTSRPTTTTTTTTTTLSFPDQPSLSGRTSRPTTTTTTTTTNLSPSQIRPHSPSEPLPWRRILSGVAGRAAATFSGLAGKLCTTQRYEPSVDLSASQLSVSPSVCTTTVRPSRCHSMFSRLANISVLKQISRPETRGSGCGCVATGLNAARSFLKKLNMSARGSTGSRSSLPGLQAGQATNSRVLSWAVSFEKLLEDPTGVRYFTDFLNSEVSGENIMFWQACEEFKKIPETSPEKEPVVSPGSDDGWLGSGRPSTLAREQLW